MTELVLAVFDAASAADAAVQDLEVAGIPSAVIRRGVPGNRSAPPAVTVAVDEIHGKRKPMAAYRFDGLEGTLLRLWSD